MSVINCPVCEKRMLITRLQCRNCDITVTGNFSSGSFAMLDSETLSFIKTFVLARGNIKVVEKELGISYPTVKTRLDRVVAKMEMVIEHEEQERRTLAQEARDRQERQAKSEDLMQKK